MVDIEEFKEWLKKNTTYSDAVITDTVSRMKRADSILSWNGTDTYLFYLENEKQFQTLSVSVKSQLRKSVKLYVSYANAISK
ncbi:MAG: hypothetical protein ACI4EE_07415 [Lachnospiraceae bacterium]